MFLWKKKNSRKILQVSSMGFGMFGMNFINGYETTPYAFISAAAFVSASGIGAYSIARVQYNKSDRQFLVGDSSFFDQLSNPAFIGRLYSTSKLTDDNIKQLLNTALGRNVTNEELEKLKMDADADGDSEISLAEMIRYLKD